MRPLPFLVSDTSSASPDTPRPAIIVPVIARSVQEVIERVRTVQHVRGVDAVEWRVDWLNTMTPAVFDQVFTALAQILRLPLIITVRSGSEGGHVNLSDADYASTVHQCIQVCSVDSSVPYVFDIEYARRDSQDLLFEARTRGLPVIASWHDFHSTPSVKQIMQTVERMAAAGADVAKVAVMPKTPDDVLSVLTASLQASQTVDIPVIILSMGRLGQVTRLYGGEFGSAATFATAGEISAPGQLSVGQVLSVLEAPRKQ